MEPGHQEPHELLSIVLVITAILRILHRHSMLKVARIEGGVCVRATTGVGVGGDGEGRGLLP